MNASGTYRTAEWLVPASELKDAVDAKLLTQDEARLIYWSQFPVIKNVASATPPAVE